MIVILFCVLDFVSRLMMKHRLKIIYYMCVNECECSMLVCMHGFACVCVYKWVNMHPCALYVDAQGRCKESTIILSPLLIELWSQSNQNYSFC